MRFSERTGKKEVNGLMQIESMNTALRTGLWNVVFHHALSETDLPHTNGAGGPNLHLLKEIWLNVLTRPVDETPGELKRTVAEIKTWFFKVPWYDVYDFMEFIAHSGGNIYDRCGVVVLEFDDNGQHRLGGPVDTDEFRQECNTVLERHSSGYRFVGNEIAPITDDVQLEAIEEAMGTTAKRSMRGVNEHIRSALEKLSDKKNPDYRNSIKESISAVESACRMINGTPKATLGQALKAIDDSLGVHPALKKGFEAIYGYTSDANGIRHAMTDKGTCDFDEAKYMLVSCSAFVNYLMGKADRAGLLQQNSDGD